MNSRFPHLTESQMRAVVEKHAERDKTTSTAAAEQLAQMIGVGAETFWRWMRPEGFPFRQSLRSRARLFAEAQKLGVSVMNEHNKEVLDGGPVRLVRSLAGLEIIPFAARAELSPLDTEQCEQEARWPYSRRDREKIYKFISQYGVEGAPVDPMRGIHAYASQDYLSGGCIVSFVWGLAPLLAPGQSAPVMPPMPEATVQLKKQLDWTPSDMIITWENKPDLPDVPFVQFEDEARAYAYDWFVAKKKEAKGDDPESR